MCLPSQPLLARVGRENRVDVIAEIVMCCYRLYSSAMWHAKCADLGLEELMDIQVVPILFVDFVQISFVLVPRSGRDWPLLHFIEFYF